MIWVPTLATMPGDDGIAMTTEPARENGRSSVGFGLFCLYTFVVFGRPQDYVPALVPLRPALVVMIVTLMVTMAQRARTRAGAPWTVESKLYLLFFAILCVGIPFSIYRRGSFNFVLLGYVVNLVYYLLFLRHVDTIERLKRIVFVITMSALVLNLVWLVQGGFTSGRYSGGSQMFDPNDIAFVEVSYLSFAASILVGRYRVLSKLLALATILSGVLLALYSGSRGGLLALGAWFLLFLALPVASVSKWRKLVIVTVVVVLAAWNANKINIDRYLTLTTIDSDYNVSEEFGRAEIWKTGLRALMERPVTGVGADCFMEAVGLQRGSEGRIEKWQAPHNSYVQVATESGVFGGMVFLILIGACLANFNELRRRGTATDFELAGLATLAMTGFVSVSVAAFFLSQGYSAQFTLFFALSAAMKGIGASAGSGTNPEKRLGVS